MLKHLTVLSLVYILAATLGTLNLLAQKPPFMDVFTGIHEGYAASEVGDTNSGPTQAIQTLGAASERNSGNTESKGKFAKPLAESFSVLNMEERRSEHKYTIYGFLPYWMLSKVDNLRLNSLTDIAYFALHINKDGSIRKLDKEGYTDPGYNNWRKSEKLDQLIKKAKAKNVNIALTIISHNDDTSTEFLSCKDCWKVLTTEVEKELKYRSIKDVNLDFEYVGAPTEKDTENYTQFVKYFNEEMDRKFIDSKVVVSTFADSSIRRRITNPDQLSKYSDALFIMAYDFHYTGSGRAGPVSPINRIVEYTSYDISSMLNDYLKFTPPNKLILGVPYYGYNWLVNAPEPYATRIDGNDDMGFSQSQTYEDLMATIIDLRPDIKWDDTALVPYFSYLSPKSNMNRVVYFENPDSLRIKYKLTKEKRLGGVGIWALGYDGGYQELWDLLDEEF